MDPSSLVIRGQIEALSADAAFLFTSGRIREASASWHKVVKRLLPLVTSDLRKAEATTMTTEVPAAPLRGAFVVIPIAPWDIPLQTRLSAEDRTFALYTSAVQYVPPRRTAGIVDDSGGDEGGNRLDDDMAVAATALYNLGLCHHLQAILDGSRATGLCAKALRAYTASQRILEESGLCVVVSPTAAAPAPAAAAVDHHLRGVCLLQLVLANNMGHVYEYLHCYDDAQRQLVALHYALESLAVDGRSASSSSPDFEDFDSNNADDTPFLPFLLTATMYPFQHKICHPAPCA